MADALQKQLVTGGPQPAFSTLPLPATFAPSRTLEAQVNGSAGPFCLPLHWVDYFFVRRSCCSSLRIGTK